MAAEKWSVTHNGTDSSGINDFSCLQEGNCQGLLHFASRHPTLWRFRPSGCGTDGVLDIELSRLAFKRRPRERQVPVVRVGSNSRDGDLLRRGLQFQCQIVCVCL